MGGIFKRLFCRHKWTHIYIPIFIGDYEVGCTECGKTKIMTQHGYRIWRFKREHKGDTFTE